MKAGAMMRLMAVVLVVGLAALLAGCGTSGGGATGRVSVALTDAPDGTFSAVNVTIESIMIHKTMGQWVSLTGTFPATADLLTLHFQQQLLGSVPLAAGHYTQTRMVLSNAPGANTVTLASDGSVHPLVVPSGAQTGIKLIGEYSVQAGQTTALVIDFDPEKTIHLDGSGAYVLRPTIPLIVEEHALTAFGALQGKIMPQGAWATAVVSAFDASSNILVAATTVIVPPDGEPPTDTDGTFRMMLPAGTYYLKVTATGFNAFDSRPTTYVVSTGVDTDAGTITLTAAP